MLAWGLNEGKISIGAFRKETGRKEPGTAEGGQPQYRCKARKPPADARKAVTQTQSA